MIFGSSRQLSKRNHRSRVTRLRFQDGEITASRCVNVIFHNVQLRQVPQIEYVPGDSFEAPFNQQVGAPPTLSAQDVQDIVAFLRTLSDGYRP